MLKTGKSLHMSTNNGQFCAYPRQKQVFKHNNKPLLWLNYKNYGLRAQITAISVRDIAGQAGNDERLSLTDLQALAFADHVGFEVVPGLEVFDGGVVLFGDFAEVVTALDFVIDPRGTL